MKKYLVLGGSGFFEDISKKLSSGVRVFDDRSVFFMEKK